MSLLANVVQNLCSQGLFTELTHLINLVSWLDHVSINPVGKWACDRPPSLSPPPPHTHIMESCGAVSRLYFWTFSCLNLFSFVHLTAPGVVSTHDDVLETFTALKRVRL